MVTQIQKDQLPMVAYSPAIIKDEIVMFNPQADGITAYFPALDQIRFMPYKEILEYMSGAELKEKEATPQGKRPREVHSP